MNGLQKNLTIIALWLRHCGLKASAETVELAIVELGHLHTIRESHRLTTLH